MTWNVFYSYAHEDEAYRERLVTALAPLRQAKFIAEWHDRKIEPGADWNAEIASQADSADLFLVPLSPEFLASDYCQGVEMERAFERVKKGAARLLPILLWPCLWEVSTFSAMQMIPRDAYAITSWPSIDEAYLAVAKEIHAMVSAPRPQFENADAVGGSLEPRFDASMELVRRQLRSYARQYERIRLRMRPSNERTSQMESLFQKMRSLAAASYPLLGELAASPLPGDRLAAVSILQVFADEASLRFLVDLVGSEKPFVGYHATRALRFAVSALDSTGYACLMAELQRAQALLATAEVGFDTDRQTELRAAVKELQSSTGSTSVPTRG